MTHPFEEKPRKKWSVNDWADFWRFSVGANIIPSDTKNKRTWIKWTEYQDEPIPLEQHEAWKESGSFETGLAVMTGKIWHNPDKVGLYLHAIDCDNKKATDLAGGDLEKNKKKTLIEWHPDNPDKIHIYGYTHYPIAKKSSDANSVLLSKKLQSNEVPAIEVKGKGKDGLMFCTPSVHKDGSHYQVGECMEPAIIDGIDKAIDKICHMYGIPYLTGALDDTDYKIPIDDLVNGSIEIFEGHNRHEAILRIAEHYTATIPDVAFDTILMMTMNRNETICKPPLEKSEIEKICKQAVDYVGRTIGMVKTKKNPDGKKKQKEEVHVIIAKKILENQYFVTLTKTHEVLWYNNGVYEYGGEEIISQEARGILPSIKKHEINEVIFYIQNVTGYHSVSEFDSDITKINVKNGIVDLITGKLSTHHHDYLSRMQLTVFYDKKAKCPRFTKFIESCHDDKEALTQIYDSMALCLIRDASFEKAYINTGEGSNGKSRFLTFLQTLLGTDACSNHSIHDLESDRFSLVDLDGKLANICADIKSDEIRSTGNLKKLISGDFVQGQKKFMPSYSFIPTATLIFSANQIPEVQDETDGFMRKFEIVEWKKQFYGKKRDHTIDTIKNDPQELSGALNIMIKTARELLQTRKLHHERSVDEMKMLWKEKADSVDTFSNQCLVRNSDSVISVQEVYSEYVSWCKSNKKTVLVPQRINQKLKILGFEYTAARIDGVTSKVWRGCDLRKNMSDKSQEMLL